MMTASASEMRTTSNNGRNHDYPESTRGRVRNRPLGRASGIRAATRRTGRGGVRVLSFGVTASRGGRPTVVDGKIIGAIGVSGAALSSQDGQVAKAGADAVK